MPLSVPQICMGLLPQLFLIVLHNLTLSLHHREAIGPWASTCCLELSVVDLAVAERRLVSSTPAKNTTQPSDITSQKLLSRPKKRARLPASAFSISPTRISTLAHKRLLARKSEIVDWRRASFQPEYNATPTTASTPSELRTMIVSVHAPKAGCKMPVPGVPAILLRACMS